MACTCGIKHSYALSSVIIKNNVGDSPLSVAQKYAQMDCISLLQEKSQLVCSVPGCALCLDQALSTNLTHVWLEVMQLETEEDIDYSPESVGKL